MLHGPIWLNTDNTANEQSVLFPENNRDFLQLSIYWYAAIEKIEKTGPQKASVH